MKNPCADHPKDCKCRVCWLVANDIRYRRLFEMPEPPTIPPKSQCVHLGTETGQTIQCPTCSGHVELKLLSCSVHGQCTSHKPVEGTACCHKCKDFQSYSPFQKRNLLYHIMPVKGNGVWQRAIEHLKRRGHIFNGRKVFAVCTGENKLDHFDLVAQALHGFADDVFPVKNNRRLREVATWLPLWERMSFDPGQITLYAHAKGVTRPVNAGTSVHVWADMMYEACLDYLPVVEHLLTHHPIAGVFKKVGEGFVGSASRWHYSGSFFWVRNDALSMEKLATIDQQWWGNEAWPGLHFHPDSAACIFHEGVVPALDMYSLAYTNDVFLQWQQWKRDHVEYKTRVNRPSLAYNALQSV